MRFLLKQFGLSDREIVNMDDLSAILNQPIDFKEVNEIIENDRVRLIDYLYLTGHIKENE